MSPYGDVVEIWHKAYWTLTVFLDRFLAPDACEAASAKAIGLWFRNAADGVETTHGAYRSLFAAAEKVFSEGDPMTLTGATYDLSDVIPLHDMRLACDLSRLYAAIWQTAQLSTWDRATINRLSRRVGRMVPRSEDNWITLDPVAFDDPDARLARRAFAVMHDHECVDNPVCERAAVIWEQEEARSAAWINDERLAREGL